MALISIEFAIGFVLFLPLYWAFRSRPALQNILLTLASLGLLWYYVSALALTVLVAFTCAIYFFSCCIERCATGRARKAFLWAGLVVAIVHLATWKYAEFFRPALAQALVARGFSQSLFDSTWLLPLGVSYYTFQGISYLHTQYRQPPTMPRRLSLIDLLQHFGLFLTISSGPIHRTSDAKQLSDYDGQPCNALTQIQSLQPRSIQAPSLALVLILTGLAKKWWLAGWLAQSAVDPVFANPGLYQSFDLLAAIYGYTLQLFFDFSGYSDLVVGLGMLLGLRLPINFRAPLLAHNIREFWNRWHISLSTWIRDYIYLPLGGNRRGFADTQCNILLAFALSGIWHGFGWNFLLWGLAHGFALVLLNIGDHLGFRLLPKRKHARDLLKSSGRLGHLLGIVITLHFVCLAFILFRTPSPQEARNVLSALFNNFHDIPTQTQSLPLLLAMGLLWMLYPLLQHTPRIYARTIDMLPLPIRALPIFITFALIVLLAPSGIPSFIYANF